MKIGWKRRRRAVLRTSLSVILLVFAIVFVGCRKQTGGSAAPDSPDGASAPLAENAPELLTHVFRPTVYPVPEDYSFVSSVTPRYDAETGALTFLASFTNGYEDENGEWHSETRTKIVTADENGILSEEDFPSAENEYMANGVFTRDGIIWLTSSFDEENGEETYRLYAKKDGSDTAAECSDVKRLFESPGRRGWFFVERLAADGDGYVYLTSEQEIAVLTPELEKAFSLTVPDFINTMAADGNGTVLVTGYFGNGQAICAVDKEKRALGDPGPIPLEANEIFFGPGRDLYYRRDNGLYAADLVDGGQYGEGELLFDFLNSDISRESASILAVYGPETVLMSERGESGTVPSLYRHAPDIDLSSVTVLRLAYTRQLDYMVPARITEFNKSHTDVRIVTDDYESAGDPDDWYGGEKRLVTEILTGTYRPDIIVVSQSGPALGQLVKRGLCADLTPYAEKPGLLNRDNIMGCVRRSFTAPDGTFFGLSGRFTLRTLVTTDALLGKYAGHDSWTPEELLDFAESLPSDCLLMEGLTRESAADMLLGPGGYASFIAADGSGCSFDSPLFIRFLEYLKTLPTAEEYGAHPPFPELGAQADPAERYRLYHEGKIALKEKYIHAIVGFLSLELDYDTKDWRLIGQPTSSDCGTAIMTESVFAVTSRDPARTDASWEALEKLFEPDEFRGGHGIPALVSEFEKEVEEYYTFDFALTYNGGASYGTKNPNRPRELREPGILTEFTKEDEERIRGVLDNHCGVPFALSADDEVTAIVEEELSAYLGGVGTAEDCAKKIQSRATIFLSENG